MGYTRIVQYGDTTEVYEYSRDIYISKKPRKHISKIRRDRNKKLPAKPKTPRSIKRSKDNFFRLVHHNLMRNEELPILITLTNYKNVTLEKGYDSLKLFFRYLNKLQYDKIKRKNTIQFIAVPETQPKSGNLHYHVIIWGLHTSLWNEERSRRLLQRIWRRGYIDVRNTTYKSEKIAGYLAKYFAKSQTNIFFSGRRAYTTSRNIYRPTTHGSNQLSDFLQHIVEPVNCTKTGEYSTMWLGKCKMSIYKNSQI